MNTQDGCQLYTNFSCKNQKTIITQTDSRYLNGNRRC